jgi:hypothetical protein
MTWSEVYITRLERVAAAVPPQRAADEVKDALVELHGWQQQPKELKFITPIYLA